MPTLILFNKPYQVLTQFTDTSNRKILTDSGPLQQHISHPRFKLPKTYWVQVEGAPSEHSRQQLIEGVELKDGPTQAAEVSLIDEPTLWQRTPPIRERKAIPTHWLKITIREGRNRQIRRMTASVGLPTLRLVRAQIGDWKLDNLQPGEYKCLTVDTPQQTIKPKPRNRIKHRSQRNRKQ